MTIFAKTKAKPKGSKAKPKGSKAKLIYL